MSGASKPVDCGTCCSSSQNRQHTAHALQPRHKHNNQNSKLARHTLCTNAHRNMHHLRWYTPQDHIHTCKTKTKILAALMHASDPRSCLLDLKHPRDSGCQRCYGLGRRQGLGNRVVALAWVIPCAHALHLPAHAWISMQEAGANSATCQLSCAVIGRAYLHTHVHHRGNRHNTCPRDMTSIVTCKRHLPQQTEMLCLI